MYQSCFKWKPSFENNDIFCMLISFCHNHTIQVHSCQSFNQGHNLAGATIVGTNVILYTGHYGREFVLMSKRMGWVFSKRTKNGPGDVVKEARPSLGYN